jgi:integrase
MHKPPTVSWYSGRAYIRLRIPGKDRPHFPLAPKNREEATERAKLVRRIVQTLLDAERADLAHELGLRAGAARTRAELDAVEIAARAIVNGDVVEARPFDGHTTFEQFATAWTSGELHKRHPKRIRAKKTAKLDAGLLRKYVYPRIGHLALAEITTEHCEQVVDAVPADKSNETVRQVAQVVSRVLRLAVYPGKLIPYSPAPKGFIPLRTTNPAKTYLRPEEDAKLLGCERVPLVWRLLYGTLGREGMRVDEALSLTWSDLDLVHGAVVLDTNKTDDPRTWALDRSVAAALRIWKERFHPSPSPSARVFVFPPGSRRAGQPLSREVVRASVLREHLELAGCTRPQLFERTPERRPMCIHDLRATFVTLALAAGKSETWVSDRTGHRSSEMIRRYHRPARSHAELELGTMKPLAEVIPELAAAGSGASRAA